WQGVRVFASWFGNNKDTKAQRRPRFKNSLIAAFFVFFVPLCLCGYFESTGSTIACITAFSKSRRVSPRLPSFVICVIMTATTFSFGSTQKCVLYAPLHPKLPADSAVPL